MLVVNLMIIMLLIYSVVLLSGVKIMFNYKYFKVLLFLFIMYPLFSNLIEEFKLGYTSTGEIIIFSIVFPLIFILGYTRNKHIYSIYNVKKDDVINIIEGYLETKNIKYEVREEKIYLPEFNKNLIVDNFSETSLNCREIKGIYFYNELVEKVRVEIKKIKKRYFPLEGMFYLACAVILYYFRSCF
ncbi:hypothetical protein GCM10008904_10450 [Paraclostridium ghonii]|uniref:Peptidase M56 domain-containing protein n=1 Tax=Paraclostridium ghonii TaxID=29358 RepID=A0ABU0MYJ3_9FIRM|nr:hypothetical protein [Paeniclostridium ghonii]MDQ0555926.1 hypothetical protein [Paeniclostridium ghonii]